MIVDYNRQTVLQKPSRFIQECPPVLFELWSLEEDAPQFDTPLSLLDEKKQDFIN